MEGSRGAVIAVGAVASLAVVGLISALVQRYRRKGAMTETRDPLDRVEGAPQIFKFVLTGGPCAGKTTSLVRLSTFLRDRGFRVYIVPEAATLLFTNGVSFQDLADDDFTFGFQWSLMETQMRLEDAFERIAKSGSQKAVLICDRGAMDGKAYMDSDSWDALLEARALSEGEIRELRYHAVFHMVTAADGAAAYYNLDNVARSESVEEAVRQDAKTQQAWLGHPHHIVIDNEQVDFDGKLQRLLRIAARLVGLPSTERASKKFLLRANPDISAFTVPWDMCVIEKIYLRTPSAGEGGRATRPRAQTAARGRRDSFDAGEADVRVDYVAIRKRSQNGFHSYGQTEVLTYNAAEGPKRRELKRILSRREYQSAKSLLADPDRYAVQQRRISFIYRNQSFHIHTFLRPIDDVSVIHVQTEDGREVELPPFVDVDTTLGELEDESAFSGYMISLKGGVSRDSPGARSPLTLAGRKSAPPFARDS